MEKTKVALVLSGGASLGSYIAGALDELLKAFASASDRYEIDIITGASAGAATSALIAHGLLFRGGTTTLHDVWVEKLDITDLLASNLARDAPVSLLSADRLEEVSQQTLRWEDPNNVGVRAPYCADNLTLALTITNMNTLPYVSRVKQRAAERTENYVQYRNSEQETFFLGSNELPTNPIWQRIAQVVRASAAIPFIFPLVRLARRADSPGQYIQRPYFTGEANFLYCDGGTFNNLPVDLAWHHAVRTRTTENRVVIVVNPWRSDAEEPDKTPKYPGLIQQVSKLLSAVMNESTALQFDNEIMLPSQAAQEKATVPAAREAERGEEDGGTRGLPGVDRAPVELLDRFALVMPEATDKRLRGNHLHALGAFLDRRFREYDFRRGAADARRVANQLLGISYDAGRGEAFYSPDGDPGLIFNISSEDSADDLAHYDNLDRIPCESDPGVSVRQRFEESLDKRINALVARWDTPGIDLISDPLFAALIRRVVHEHLPKAWEL